MSLQEIEIPIEPEIDFMSGRMVTIRYTTRLDDSADLARLYEHNPEYVFIGFIKTPDGWTPYYCAARHHPELQKALELKGIAVDSFIKAQLSFSPGQMLLSQMTVFPEAMGDQEFRAMLMAGFAGISPAFLSRSISVYDSTDSHIADYDSISKRLFLRLSPPDFNAEVRET